MKTYLLIIVLLLAGTLAFAHPAGAIKARYEAETKTLSFSFDHQVKDQFNHYINTVLVKLNGITIISQTANAQDSLEGGEFSYRIPLLKKGDEIEIITECNKSGKKSSKMILN